MSESNSDHRPKDTPEGAADDALDLSDLDELGVEGVVARLRGEQGDGGEGAPVDLDLEAPAPAKRRRSPLLSFGVLALGVYLLVTMFGDFRYWLHAREPVDLGHAADLIRDGFPADLDEQYVVLQGTPDVQHAARLAGKDEHLSYLRLTEGGGSLFAAVPRVEGHPTTLFEGRFEGRMRRLSKTRAFPWVEQFFNGEGISRVIDSDGESLAAAVAQTDGGALVAKAGEGRITIDPRDRVRIVVDQPEATVQLGKTSFKNKTAADEAVAALGYPWIRPDRKSRQFHSYLVRIPQSERETVEASLNDGVDTSKAEADPSVGSVILPRSVTYVLEARDLSAGDDGALAFPLPEGGASPGYEVRDGALVERKLQGAMSVPVASIAAVRFEKPVQVDPNGYVVLVGDDPSTAWQWGVLWLVALGIVLVNAATLGLALRRSS